MSRSRKLVKELRLSEEYFGQKRAASTVARIWTLTEGVILPRRHAGYCGGGDPGDEPRAGAVSQAHQVGWVGALLLS